MRKTNVKFITNTAMLLAVIIVVQMIGTLISDSFRNLVVGSLVNACLLIATAFAGIWSGLIIAIAAPYMSLINNHATIAPFLVLFAPFIAMGNFIFVLSFYLLRKKSKIAGITAGAVLKFAFLYAAILVFFIVIKNMDLTAIAKFEKPLTLLFSYPQLITAFIGGAIAFSVIKLLKNQRREM